jgi:hypothetical protein
MCHALYSTSETAYEILHRAVSVYKPYVTSRAEKSEMLNHCMLEIGSEAASNLPGIDTRSQRTELF